MFSLKHNSVQNFYRWTFPMARRQWWCMYCSFFSKIDWDGDRVLTFNPEKIKHQGWWSGSSRFWAEGSDPIFAQNTCSIREKGKNIRLKLNSESGFRIFFHLQLLPMIRTPHPFATYNAQSIRLDIRFWLTQIVAFNFNWCFPSKFKLCFHSDVETINWVIEIVVSIF